MKNSFNKSLFVVTCAFSVLGVQANVLDKPEGIKIGKRLTLRPYVSVSASYDTNVRARKNNSNEDMMWMVSPGMGLIYEADNWALQLSGYYTYRHYNKNENSDYNRHSYGEDLRWNWSNSAPNEKGWSLILNQGFQQVTMSDDMTLGNGRGYQADSRELHVNGAAQRRFNEHWHGTLSGGYYWLDYLNDINAMRGSSFYGWDRWNVGGEMGFAPSKWTDFILSGSYMGYTQDNAQMSSIASSDSQGYSVQGGIGSYMTDRISYRLLMGWSRFEYGNGGKADDGFVYTASGNWKISDTWSTMLVASSYYQPSERQYASSSRIDSLSWGIAKSMVRGKLCASFDLMYRRETHNYAGSGYDNDYTLDIFTGRLGLDYNLNRLMALFAYGEYQNSANSGSSRIGSDYDYERWRVTTGIRFKY